MNMPLEPKPSIRKVGRWTVAIGLIGVGCIIALQMGNIVSFELLKYVWPALIIMLGIELLVANISHPEQKVRLGGLSVTILILLILASLAQTTVPGWTNIFTPRYASNTSGTVEVNESVKRVQVHLPEGRINVTGTSGSTVSYDGELLMKASSQEKADQDLKEHWQVKQEGDTLILTLDTKKTPWYFHLGINTKTAYLNVQVPESLSTELVTKDGRIQAKQLSGDVSIQTSDGSVLAQEIKGRLNVKTSDGSITAEQVGGDVELITSNGSVKVHEIKGRLNAKTSDGSITAEQVGGDAELITSNGKMTLNSLNGAVHARTSDGSIKGTSIIAGSWDLKSSNGSVHLTIPEDSSTTIEAKTSNGSYKGDVNWVEQDKLRTAIVGGGLNPLKIYTSDGSITVDYGQ